MKIPAGADWDRERDSWAEHDRLMRGDTMARPTYPLGGTARSDGKRDPSPMWDWWYSLALSTRRQLLPFMSGTLTPDELATEQGCSIDQAGALWIAACQLIRAERLRVRGALAQRVNDPTSAAYAAEWAQFDAEQLRRSALDIFGPQELAKEHGVRVDLIYQWVKRGRLPKNRGGATIPAPDLTVSAVPLWHVETLRAAGLVESIQTQEWEQF